MVTPYHVFMQLTGALRSLSDSPSLTHTFVSAILPNLAAVLSDHMNSADIVFNLSRVLRYFITTTIFSVYVR